MTKTDDVDPGSAQTLGSACLVSLVDFVERYGIHPEKLPQWQREIIAGLGDFRPITTAISRNGQKTNREALEAYRAVFHRDS